MLDIYWNFSEAGDHYLGHILKFLDPLSADFGVIPPQFIVPSDDPLRKEGLNFCFGKIIEVETRRKIGGYSFC